MFTESTAAVGIKKEHTSRYGYHPCNYDTYAKLKELYGFYHKCLRIGKAWFRWRRKQPQNRHTKEPAIPPIFIFQTSLADIQSKYKYKYKFNKKQGHVTYLRTLDTIWIKTKHGDAFFYSENGLQHNSEWTIIVDDMGIIEAYENARTPRKNIEDVQPLNIDEETINQLYNAMKKWNP